MKKVEPKADLSELLLEAIFQIKNYSMNAIGVSYEMIVYHVVISVAGKLPQTEFAI